MKVLITSGGTREHIDAARVVTNTSTGRTGRVLAELLAARTCSVLCLRSAAAERPSGRGIRVRNYESFSDLDAALRTALKAERFDAVIHLAAVSDYSPVLIEAGARKYRPGRSAKISSAAGELRVILRRNFKILDRIKSYAAAGSHPAPLLIAFKLTAGAGKAQALRKVRALASADLVVHNDTREMKKTHPFHIYRSGRRIFDCEGPEELAEKLFDLIPEFIGTLDVAARGQERKTVVEPAACLARRANFERGHGAAERVLKARSRGGAGTGSREAICC